MRTLASSTSWRSTLACRCVDSGLFLPVSTYLSTLSFPAILLSVLSAGWQCSDYPLCFENPALDALIPTEAVS
jgi:hypothetical protein